MESAHLASNAPPARLVHRMAWFALKSGNQIRLVTEAKDSSIFVGGSPRKPRSGSMGEKR
jgi:hypothetical protein